VARAGTPPNYSAAAGCGRVSSSPVLQGAATGADARDEILGDRHAARHFPSASASMPALQPAGLLPDAASERDRGLGYAILAERSATIPRVLTAALVVGGEQRSL